MGDAAAGSDGDVPSDGGGAGMDECALDCGDGLMCDQGRCVECTLSTRPRCNENAPVVCEDGVWVELALCGGDTPACSNGECVAAVLAGSFSTVSKPLLSTDEIQLAEHGMEHVPISCTEDKSICMTGGIYP